MNWSPSNFERSRGEQHRHLRRGGTGLVRADDGLRDRGLEGLRDHRQYVQVDTGQSAAASGGCG